MGQAIKKREPVYFNNDILHLIFSNQSAKDIVNNRLVCKVWCATIEKNNDFYFRVLTLKEFPLDSRIFNIDSESNWEFFYKGLYNNRKYCLISDRSDAILNKIAIVESLAKFSIVASVTGASLMLAQVSPTSTIDINL